MGARNCCSINECGLNYSTNSHRASNGYGIIIGVNCGLKLADYAGLAGWALIVVFVIVVLQIVITRYWLDVVSGKEVRMKNTYFQSLIVDTLVQIEVNVFASTLLA